MGRGALPRRRRRRRGGGAGREWGRAWPGLSSSRRRVRRGRGSAGARRDSVTLGPPPAPGSGAASANPARPLPRPAPRPSLGPPPPSPLPPLPPPSARTPAPPLAAPRPRGRRATVLGGDPAAAPQHPSPAAARHAARGEDEDAKRPEVAPQRPGARLPGHRGPLGDMCLRASLEPGTRKGKAGGRASPGLACPWVPRGGHGPGLDGYPGCRLGSRAAARRNALPEKLGGLRGGFAFCSWTAFRCGVCVYTCMSFPPTSWGGSLQSTFFSGFTNSTNT